VHRRACVQNKITCSCFCCRDDLVMIDDDTYRLLFQYFYSFLLVLYVTLFSAELYARIKNIECILYPVSSSYMYIRRLLHVVWVNCFDAAAAAAAVNVELVCVNVSALQIFKLESHPSGFKAETGREGFSLYGTTLTKFKFKNC